MNESPKYKLNQIDWKKIGKGFGLALGGATLTYATSLVGSIDFGAYAPLVAVVWSTVLNAATKWLSGQESTLV